MTGYDGLASGIILALPQFRRDYGREYKGDYVVPAEWQLGFTGASLIGLILGGICSGWMIAKSGRRFAMLVAFGCMVGGTFMQWFSPGNLGLFLAGKFVTGFPAGIFTSIAPSYCSEVVPLAFRGSMTAAINFSLVIGQLLGYGVMRETSSRAGDMSYKIMYAVQWGFAAIGLAFLPFFLESPYLLVTKGKTEHARRNIAKMFREGTNVNNVLADIQLTLEQNSTFESEQGGYKQCFSKAHRMRTLIACSTFFIQAMSGVTWVLSYLGYFLSLGGMNGKAVFDTSVGIMGIMAIGNMFGWVLVERLGRRNTALYGSTILTITLVLIGIIAVVPTKNAIWAQVAFMACWAFTYQATIGAAAWPIITEVPTSSLRAATTSLCVMVNGGSNALWSFALPYAVNPDQGNLQGKVGFLFGGSLFLCTIFIWFFYPETKNRTFNEIDELFGRGVNPRHFQKVDLRDGQENGSA